MTTRTGNSSTILKRHVHGLVSFQKEKTLVLFRYIFIDCENVSAKTHRKQLIKFVAAWNTKQAHNGSDLKCFFAFRSIKGKCQCIAGWHYLSTICQISTNIFELPFIYGHEKIYSSLIQTNNLFLILTCKFTVKKLQGIPAYLIDLQRRQMRKKIIPHKKAHKYKVIHNSLKINVKGRLNNL